MADRNSAQIVNLILMFVVCLMLGGIGGYLVAEMRKPSLPISAGGVSGSVPSNLSDVLSLEHAWIVEGLSCPEPGCARTLRDCDHTTARQTRAQVNSQLATGKSGEEITADIIRRHGKAVFKLGDELQR